ncbi:MAG: vanillate O-demethylase oxidoreductase VanB [Blastocatellia bacterium]|nr:MAG: vanillate O-demethylase oxidoreductase VanB [Blastocatellia bacterium]
MTVTVTDRIEKKILLRAASARVWRALTDSREFGEWFGVKFDGPFEPGALLRGVIVGTTVDHEVAKAQKEHEGLPVEITVDRIEPERIFAFRWHPFAVERDVAYSAEPTTLVVFALEEVPDGTMLTVTESGFDRIPMARRAKAFTANEHGWTVMVRVFEKYLAQAA